MKTAGNKQIQAAQSICVLGMHRSGTSCLTGIMQRLGVELGEVFESNPFNKRGNREHPRIMALNDAVLEHNNGAWDRPVEVRDWTQAHMQERQEILQDLSDRGSAFWGFKDPRFLLTRPFWLEVMSPLYIATFRHPERVARSLQHRSGMCMEEGLALWYEYNTRLLDMLDKTAAPLVNFDLPQESYLHDVLHKLAGLGLAPEQKASAALFFDQSLRHQQAHEVSTDSLPPKIASLYAQLKAYYARSAPGPWA